jgi:hypothetical protein
MQPYFYPTRNMTSKKNGRQPHKKNEKNGRQPKKMKMENDLNFIFFNLNDKLKKNGR